MKGVGRRMNIFSGVARLSPRKKSAGSLAKTLLGGGVRRFLILLSHKFLPSSSFALHYLVYLYSGARVSPALLHSSVKVI